jgi:hypothetical protein
MGAVVKASQQASILAKQSLDDCFKCLESVHIHPDGNDTIKKLIADR